MFPGGTKRGQWYEMALCDNLTAYSDENKVKFFHNDDNKPFK